LAKTRSVATDWVAKKKVLCNDTPVKAAKEIKPGDVLKFQKANAWFSYKVLDLTEKRIGAVLVTSFILDITPEEERLKWRNYIEAQKAYQHYGTGKPTKKDRRDISQFTEEASRLKE
jgi:ribosome-associated heat shock protein Hsp15